MANTNFILAVVLVLMGGFLYYSELHDVEGKEDREWTSTRVVNFEPDNIYKMTIGSTTSAVSQMKPFTVLRDADGKWEIISPLQDVADKNETETIIGHIYNLKNEREVKATKDADAEYGFSNPRAKVTLFEKMSDGSERSIELQLGQRNPVDYLSYLKVKGKDTVFLVNAGIDEHLTKNSSDLRQRKLFKLKNRSDIASISVAIENDTPMVLNLANGMWSTDTSFPCPIDQKAADTLADSFRSLLVDFFVEETPQELTTYGLTTPSVRFEATLTNQKKLILQIGAMASGSLESDPTREISGWYAKTNLRDTVYVIAEHQYRKLAKRLIDVRDRSITPDFLIEEISCLECSFKDGTNALVKKRGSNWYMMDKERKTLCDKAYVEKLLGALTNLQAQGVVSDYKEGLQKTGLANPDVVITLHNTVEDTKTELAVRWNTRDKLFVQNRDRLTSYSIDYQMVRLFPEKRADLFNRRPARSLRASDITSSVIEAIAMETIELTAIKESDARQWKLVRPTSSTLDIPQVEEWFTRIRGLQVEKFIQEGKENLNQFGLSSPLAKTTVTWAKDDGSATTLTISIGAETANKLFHYGMTDNCNAVFTVRKAMARHLLIPSLTYKESSNTIPSDGKQSKTQLSDITPDQYVPTDEERRTLPRAIIQTSSGPITVILFEDDAPNHVANFVFLSENNFYNNTRFHRVESFCIQGGDPNSKDDDPTNDGKGGPGYAIKDEISDIRKHKKYYLSMAHRGPNTGGSQFFILKTSAPWLDGVHTVFGAVIEGGDIVDSIKAGTIINEINILNKRNHKYTVEKCADR